MARAKRLPKVDEIPYMRSLMIALGARPELRIHRQNCGQIPVRDRTGKVVRVFDPGPPNGAADISGIVRGSGRRIEIETKAAKGEQSDEQKAWQRMIESFGGIYVLAGYDETLSLDDNVQRAVNLVLFSISLAA